VGAGIAVVLIAATAVSLRQAVIATEAGEVAKKAERLANDRLGEKERALEEATGISTFLEEVFRSPDLLRDGRMITVAETLDKAAKKLETELTSQPARRAKLQAILGVTYSSLGLYPDAIRLQESLRDYYTATGGVEHPNRLVAMNNLANSYSDAGRWEEAIGIHEEVLSLSRKTKGLEHPEIIKSLSN